VRRLLAVALLLAACAKPEPPPTSTGEDARRSTPPPPTAAAAQELIANSADFGDFHFTDAAFSYPQHKPPHALVKAGWLQADGTLTEKAKSDKRFLVRPNGFVDVVPLAKKAMLGVVAVRPQPDGNVLADFGWKWEPNELGTLLATPSPNEQKATAKLTWDGTAWTILSIKS
jgi:hypothetical protein